MAISAVGRGGVIEAAVGAAADVEIVDVRGGQVVHRQVEQLPRKDRGDFLLKERIAVLLILLEIGDGAFPTEDEIAEVGDIFAKPNKGLNLLPVELPVLLLELF